MDSAQKNTVLSHRASETSDNERAKRMNLVPIYYFVQKLPMMNLEMCKEIRLDSAHKNTKSASQRVVTSGKAREVLGNLFVVQPQAKYEGEAHLMHFILVKLRHLYDNTVLDGSVILSVCL